MEGRVVVNLTCRLYFHADRQYFSAHCPELGMTAFGETADAAVERFKLHFNEAIDAYRKQGALERVLRNSGVPWRWEWDAPADLAFEDTGAAPLLSNVPDSAEERASARELELAA